VSAIAYPEHNPRRNEQVDTISQTERWIYDNKDYDGEKFNRSDLQITSGTTLRGKWVTEEMKVLPGGFCAQRRLFVMKKDLLRSNSVQSGRNWDKIRVPL
jgi:hypothetical protein